MYTFRYSTCVVMEYTRWNLKNVDTPTHTRHPVDTRPVEKTNASHRWTMCDIFIRPMDMFFLKGGIPQHYRSCFAGLIL